MDMKIEQTTNNRITEMEVKSIEKIQTERETGKSRICRKGNRRHAEQS